MLIFWSAKCACSTPQNGGHKIVVQRQKIVFLRFFYGFSTVCLRSRCFWTCVEIGTEKSSTQLLVRATCANCRGQFYNLLE